MKIIALIGSQRKNGSGYKYIAQIEKKVRSMSEAEFEYLFLSDYDIKLCRGCMVCYEKGEAACPLKDDYLAAIRKLLAADAVIFYSPTYTLSISGMLKNFFDRSSYICHRPLFKGKRAIIMTSVAAFGDKLALDTLKWIVSAIGFEITGKIGIRTGRYDSNPMYASKMDKRLEYEAARLIKYIERGLLPKPRLFELMTYYYQKNFFAAETEGCTYDKKYWRESGWADPDTDYFYKVNIPRIKKAAAKLISKLLLKLGNASV